MTDPFWFDHPDHQYLIGNVLRSPSYEEQQRKRELNQVTVRFNSEASQSSMKDNLREYMLQFALTGLKIVTVWPDHPSPKRAGVFVVYFEAGATPQEVVDSLDALPDVSAYVSARRDPK